MREFSVVGNAQSIIGKGNGSLIDSRPVIRFNWNPIVNPYDQGTRTDIVACSQLDNARAFHGMDMLYMYFPNDKKMPSGLWDVLDKKPSNGIKVLWYADMHDWDLNIFGFDWKDTPTMYDPDGCRKDGSHNYYQEEQLARRLIEENRWTLH